MQKILQEAIDNNRHWTAHGAVASYIPELAKENRAGCGNQLGHQQRKNHASGAESQRRAIVGRQ